MKKEYIQPLNENGKVPDAFKMFKGEMKGSHTRSELAVWHTYIQNLENSLLIDEVIPDLDEIKMRLNPFNHVFYVKSLGSTYNELKSGLISFLKNLEYLTDKHGELTSDLKELLVKNNWRKLTRLRIEVEFKSGIVQITKYAFLISKEDNQKKILSF